MEDWQSIVKENSPAVWRTAYRILGNEADASDCYQETFIAALEAARREPVRKWAAFLCRIATNQALDQLRRRVRQISRSDGPADWNQIASREAGPAEKAGYAELGEHLRQALTQLNPEQAEVFCLAALEGQSYREIAAQVKKTTSEVGVLLHRARTQLRELLSNFVSEESKNEVRHDRR